MKEKKSKKVALIILGIMVVIDIFLLGIYGTEVYASTSDIIAESADLTEREQRTLDLINEYRKENGLAELKTYDKLQEVAKLKAEDLVNNEYFSHNSETLGTPFEMLKSNKLDYKIAGENLAGNTTPERAFDSWINSPSHRDNILEGDYEYTAIYIVQSPMYGEIYVQLFIGM